MIPLRAVKNLQVGNVQTWQAARVKNLQVKFCGLRTAADIACVNQIFRESRAQLPQYAGFICVPGKRRFVAPAKILQLRQALLPQIRAVGVFQNQEIAQIVELLGSGAIDLVQLHGQENAAYIAQLRQAISEIGKDPRGLILQAFGIKNQLDVAAANKSAADFVLCDAKEGGSGETFDWTLLSGISRPYFLAGGLNAQNVPAALAALRPIGVDLASGIEGSDGAKNLALMREFATAISKSNFHWQTAFQSESDKTESCASKPTRRVETNFEIASQISAE